MLEPHRFMNFNYCLIHVTARIIDCLLQRHESNLDELLNYANQYNSEINELDITQAVSFLFLLGKIEYSNSNDVVRLRKAVAKC